MATKKSTQASAAPAEARALVDLPALGARAGGLVSADPETIAALVLSGDADPHPDAVAYAKAQAAQEP